MPSIRVATWNIRQGIGGDAVNYPNQQTNVEACLTRIDADLIAVQEVQIAFNAGFSDIATNLGYTWLEGPTAGFGSTFHMGYWYKSPVSLTSSETIEVSAITDQFERAPFAVVWDVSGTAFMTVNAHLTSRCCSDYMILQSGDFHRAQEMDSMLNYAIGKRADAGWALPTLIMGDFNEDDAHDDNVERFDAIPVGRDEAAAHDDASHRFPLFYAPYPSGPCRRFGIFIAEAYLEGTNTTTTFYDRLPNDPDRDYRLDYIAYSDDVTIDGAEVYDSAVDASGGLTKPGTKPATDASEDASDHLMVFADITI